MNVMSAIGPVVTWQLLSAKSREADVGLVRRPIRYDPQTDVQTITEASENPPFGHLVERLPFAISKCQSELSSR